MRPEQFPTPRPGGDPPSEPPLGPPVGTERFAEAARLCAEGRDDLARRGHAPDGTRRLRRFPLSEVARWHLGLPAADLRRALREDPDLPRGEAATPGAAPSFSFEEILQLRARFAAKREGPALAARPEGAAPRTVAVANFKGGVGKTSLAAHLAMAAALDGLRVLVVDLDSQGSLSAVFGQAAEDAWGTAYPLLARDYAQTRREAGQDLDEALARAEAMSPADVIRPTHWPAIDLLPAQLDLYWAEFQIPVWRLASRSWKLWDALANALSEAAEETGGYDLVILDTPPALGYLTINALSAADILMVPLGASFLEFDSTGRFFDMLHATFASIEEGEAEAARALGFGEMRFEWDAVRCVLTRFEAAQQAEMAEVMSHWFGDLLAGRRLEATALVGQAGEQTKAIHEADPRDFDPRTYARGRETFDAVWSELRGLLEQAWARELADAGGPGPEAGAGAGFARETPGAS
jgi:chromosome partitioning protein